MFLSGFFGYQDDLSYKFHLYGLSHIAPILIMGILIMLIYIYRNKLRNNKYESLIRYIFGAIIILTQMAYSFNNVHITNLLYQDFIAKSLESPFPFPFASITKDLPLSLCGISMILTGFLLFNKSEKLFDVLYFWVVIGSVLAIFLPSAIANNEYGHFGPDKFRYYQFWIGHIGIVLIIFYMIFVWQYKINFKSTIRSFVWLVILGINVLIINHIIGANYLFLIDAKATGLSFFPEYPLGTVVFFFLSLILYGISYLPWHFTNNNQKILEKKEIA